MTVNDIERTTDLTGSAKGSAKENLVKRIAGNTISLNKKFRVMIFFDTGKHINSKVEQLTGKPLHQLRLQFNII